MGETGERSFIRVSRPVVEQDIFDELCEQAVRAGGVRYPLDPGEVDPPLEDAIVGSGEMIRMFKLDSSIGSVAVNTMMDYVGERVPQSFLDDITVSSRGLMIRGFREPHGEEQRLVVKIDSPELRQERAAVTEAISRRADSIEPWLPGRHFIKLPILVPDEYVTRQILRLNRQGIDPFMLGAGVIGYANVTIT